MDQGMSQDPSMGGGMPTGDPGMGGDPMMGGDAGMGMDQSMGGGMPGGDQTMEMDPSMGGGMDGGAISSDDQELLNLIGKLTIKDKATAMKYMESMIDTNGNGAEDELAGDVQQPMMENVIFSKGQLRKIHESIRPSMDTERGGKSGMAPQKKRTVTGKSPFNAPNFK